MTITLFNESGEDGLESQGPIQWWTQDIFLLGALTHIYAYARQGAHGHL